MDTQIGFLVGLLFACNLAMGQAPVNILSINQGLPKSQIYDIVQDSFGFIWIGTRDGLVKYDGNTPQVFRSGDGVTPFNYIFDLHLDSRNRLWMTSNADYQGAAFLDLTTGQFHHINRSNYPGLAHDGVVAVTEDLHKQIALLTRDFQVSILSADLDAVRTFDLHAFLPSFAETLTSFHILGDSNEPGVFWIASSGSVYRFDSYIQRLERVIDGVHWNPTELFIDNQQDSILWVGLEQYGGLLKINTRDRDDIQYFSMDGSRDTSGLQVDEVGPRFNVFDLGRKSRDELYITTADRGLGVFNINRGTFNFDQHYTDALAGDFLRTLFVNKEGEVWMGADKSGLYYLRPEQSLIKLRLFRDNIIDRSQFHMTDILPIDDDTFILTFYHYPEVWIWHRKENKLEKVFFRDKELYATEVFVWENEYFLATNQGIRRLDLQNRKIVSDEFWSDIAKTSLINNRLQDHAEIWFVDWGKGLTQHRKDKTVHYQGGESEGLKHTWTHDLIYGPDGEIWLGQQNGLYSIDPTTSEISTYSHRDDLSGFVSPNFKALAFDEVGFLWVGNFGGGIACFDPSTRKVLFQMDIGQGLPSNRIYDLILDDDGYIWVWSSDGLCSFFPVQNLDEIQVQYYPETKFFPVGRLGVWFTKLETGEIFFGVSGGFAHFDPRMVRAGGRDHLDDPIITDFSVLNGSVKESLSVFKDQIIKLKPRQNFFSISFSAPKSGFGKQQKFQYQMQGLDPSWVQSEDLRTVTYTDLRPGTYQFQAKVGDQNGRWSEASAPLNIVLAAPWYATNVAKLVWILLALGLLYLINRILIFRERLRSQLALQKVESENLRELDAAKSNFFAQISHEFRTPLTVILGMASRLKQDLNGQIKGIKGIDAIERNGTLLLKQINQILDLSKLRSDTISLEMVQGDVVFYVRYLTEAFDAYTASKNIDLHFEADPDKLYMDFDPSRMRDIFTNLLSNAIKFTGPGGQIDIQVQGKHRDNSDYFLLTIADTGIGIHPDDLAKVFDPYYQSKDAQNRQGTGLGLATTQQWVQAMGGQITVESKVDVGSIFKVELPITREANISDGSWQQLDKVAASDIVRDSTITISSHKPIVLVIEDNQDVVSYIAMCLGDTYDLLFAYDGQQGIDIAIRSVPDLIITDVMMPQKDGYEVCAYVKAQEVSNHIPIIMLTAKVTQEEKKVGLSLGADAYMTKPFDEQELLIRVNGLISQRRTLQDKYGGFRSSDDHRDDTHDELQDQFLDRIQEFVEKRLKIEFSVEDLAAHMGMSRVQLYRKVKALSGKSVSMYIRFIRLYKARQMLKSTQLTVSEVAYAVGFSDPSYFSKAFKEAFLLSPREVHE
ncbi:MAG: helix-turn-helix domain-containing protein [Saprospiraceae bacterium]|nr:helix-turn-helix domain-containing protein [Saprospiraceae bacterium]